MNNVKLIGNNIDILLKIALFFLNNLKNYNFLWLED